MARWDTEGMNSIIPSNDIQCTTCVHRLKPITRGKFTINRATYGNCEKYDYKPNDVLWSKANCPKYTKDPQA